ncbi:MAG TPA: hypothetical protein VF132_11390, partial [Rudaea sp.]
MGFAEDLPGRGTDLHRFAIAMVFLLCASKGFAAPNVCPTQIVDDHAVHIHNAADAAAVRQSLYLHIFGQQTLPTSDDVTVVSNIASPIQCSADLARVDELQLSMPVRSGGAVELLDGPVSSVLGVAFHFVPAHPIHKLAIVHQGHLDNFQMDTGPYAGTCDRALSGGEDDLNYYGIQPTINALISDGYDVLAVLMPLYVPGQCKGFQHLQLFVPGAEPAAGGTGLRYFVEMTLQGVNHLLSTGTYTDVSMTGLSGGGWTTTLYAALDPRVSHSFPVAGSLPLYLRNGTLFGPGQDSAVSDADPCAELGDREQYDTDLYSIAGYPDLYALGAFGAGREQVQILNRNDNCCFGMPEHADPQTYDNDLRGYESNVRNALTELGAGSFRLQIDEASTSHQISRDAIHNVILARLDGAQPNLGADSTGRAFRRGPNGHLWINDGGGWRDLGFRMVGVPAVLENSAYPIQIALRNAVNEPEVVFNDGTGWSRMALPNDGLPNLPYGTGKIIADPVISSAEDGAFDVIAQGTDFGFYRWHVTSGGATFERVGGSTYGVGAPSVSRADSGALSIAYRSGEEI